MTEPPRFYGTDITADRETIAEATILDDGTVYIEVVTLERSDLPEDPET